MKRTLRDGGAAGAASGVRGPAQGPAQGPDGAGAFDGIALLRGLSPDLARRHAAAIRWIEAEAGQLVLDFDEASDEVFFVATGAVRVQVRTPGGRELILTEVGAGDFFGDMSAVDGAPRSAAVTALHRTRLARLGGAAFRGLLTESPDIAMRLLRVLIARVRDANARMLELTSLDIRHRLYAELLRQAGPSDPDGTARLSPPPIQHILASRIGARREAVSREIARLLREGLAERRRGALVLRAPHLLRRAIDDALGR